MKKYKECIMCFSEIDARAKKCPQCTSLQAKYSNLENNPLLIGLVGIFIVCLFGFIVYDNVYLRELKNKASDSLIVDVHEIITKKESDGLYVACIGSIRNNTQFKFKDLEYEVNFYSEQDVLVDTFSITEEENTVRLNDTTNVRVRGIAQKESSDDKRCEVKLLDAWAF